MQLIRQITTDTLQKQNVILPDGSFFTMTLYFVPMQYGWFIQNLTYGDFEINNWRICVSPNMLFQFRHQIPFGLACFSTASREPSQQQDFASGAAKLYLLSESEVDEYADYLSG